MSSYISNYETASFVDFIMCKFQLTVHENWITVAGCFVKIIQWEYVCLCILVGYRNPPLCDAFLVECVDQPCAF